MVLRLGTLTTPPPEKLALAVAGLQSWGDELEVLRRGQSLSPGQKQNRRRPCGLRRGGDGMEGGLTSR